MIFLERLKKIETQYVETENALSEPDVVKDQTRFQKLTRDLSKWRPLVETFRALSQMQNEHNDLKANLDDPDMDADMRGLYEEEVKTLFQKMEEKKNVLENLLLEESDPNSGRDVIVEIRAGTGGNEATLFATDLFRMFTRYAANQGLKVEVLSSTTTGVGGFKDVSFGVSGPKSYGLFKFEMGIHRVQRVPETESSGRIHTSAVTVAVLPEVEADEIEIASDDLRIDVFRASGAGGQHVNKTESAVRITHIPTGFVVSCQDERSQHKNRARAMRVLRARIYEFVQAKQAAELAKQRKDQIGSGDRSGKIRTYNFPDQRVTDHRIGLTLHSLDDILDGHLDPLVQALENDERERRLTDSL